MLSIIVLDTLQEESTSVSQIIKTAYSSREMPIKRLALYTELAQLAEIPKGKMRRYNVFIASFSNPGIDCIDFAKKLRLQNTNMFIVFIVDKNTDISSCVRPSIRPSGILFIPLDEKIIYQTIKEIYIEYLKQTERKEQPAFMIKSGGEYFSINTGEISFFEAQGKKIAVKTRGQEILFYSNFEAVLEQLPDWFVRCHKGYVVNTKQIVQASFTEMTLKLKDQSVIPLSRTYRDEIRTLMEARGV